MILFRRDILLGDIFLFLRIRTGPILPRKWESPIISLEDGVCFQRITDRLLPSGGYPLHRPAETLVPEEQNPN